MRSNTGIDRVRSSIVRYNKVEDLSEILPGLYLGGLHSVNNLNRLKDLGVSHIVSVHKNATPISDPFFQCKCIHINDTVGEDLSQFFEEVIFFIQLARINSNGVLIHCLAGVSRSATLVIAYLMTIFENDLDSCINFVIHMRSCINPNWGFLSQLSDFEQTRRSQVHKIMFAVFSKSHDLLEKDYSIFTDYKKDMCSSLQRPKRSFMKNSLVSSGCMLNSNQFTLPTNSNNLPNENLPPFNSEPCSQLPRTACSNSFSRPANNIKNTVASQSVCSQVSQPTDVLVSSATTKPFVLDLASGRRKIFSTRVASVDVKCGSNSSTSAINTKKVIPKIGYLNTSSSEVQLPIKSAVSNLCSLNNPDEIHDREKIQSASVKPVCLSNDTTNFCLDVSSNCMSISTTSELMPHHKSSAISNNENNSKDSAFVTKNTSSTVFTSEHSVNLSGITDRKKAGSTADNSLGQVDIYSSNSMDKSSNIEPINRKTIDLNFSTNDPPKSFNTHKSDNRKSQFSTDITRLMVTNASTKTGRKLSLNDSAFYGTETMIDPNPKFKIATAKSNENPSSSNDDYHEDHISNIPVKTEINDQNSLCPTFIDSNLNKNANTNNKKPIQNKQQEEKMKQSIEQSFLSLLNNDHIIYENDTNNDTKSSSSRQTSCPTCEPSGDTKTSNNLTYKYSNGVTNETDKISPVDTFNNYIAKATVEFERHFSRNSYSISSCKSEEISCSDDNIFSNKN